MPRWKRWLWTVRIWKGIFEVKRLAAKYPSTPEYKIDDAMSALSVFEEYSSQAHTLLHTTPEEGEVIEMLFLHQWNATQNNTKRSTRDGDTIPLSS